MTNEILRTHLKRFGIGLLFLGAITVIFFLAAGAGYLLTESPQIRIPVLVGVALGVGYLFGYAVLDD